jgi:hypothetical protein
MDDADLFWWPGQLVVRVRERGIASAQEATGKFSHQQSSE